MTSSVYSLAMGDDVKSIKSGAHDGRWEGTKGALALAGRSSMEGRADLPGIHRPKHRRIRDEFENTEHTRPCTETTHM